MQPLTPPNNKVTSYFIHGQQGDDGKRQFTNPLEGRENGYFDWLKQTL